MAPGTGMTLVIRSFFSRSASIASICGWMSVA